MNEAIGAGARLPARAQDKTRVRLALLIVLVLACLLPGFFTIPIVDRDEARFAQASRQMVESGDYVVPRLGDDTRFKKPIGIYWLQSAAVALTGHDAQAPIWVFRLPSLAGALLAVLLTFFVGRRLFGEEAGFIAAALIGTSLVLVVEARLAKTDAVQLAAALAGQWVLAQAYLARADEKLGLRRVLLFWGAMAVGILVKGPIVPLLAGLTVAALALWDRRAAWTRQLRPVLGVPFMLLLVLPWLAAIASQSGADFFHEAVGKDLLGKVATGQESHGAPPGAHFLTFWMAFWPGAALAAAAVPWVWAHRAEPAVRFCLAWAIPFWIVFELIATKLPHYTLPAYPALALLAAAALAAPRTGPEPLWQRLLMIAALLGGALGAVGAMVAFNLLEQRVPPVPLILAVLLVLLAVYGARQALVAGLKAALRPLLVQAAGLYILIFGMLAPQADGLWITPRLSDALARVACPQPQVMVAGFGEASVLFTLGTVTRFGNGIEAADFLAGGQGCRVAIVADRQQPLFEARNKMRARPPKAVETVAGINGGNSRYTSLILYVAAPPASGAKGAVP